MGECGCLLWAIDYRDGKSWKHWKGYAEVVPIYICRRAVSGGVNCELYHSCVNVQVRTVSGGVNCDCYCCWGHKLLIIIIVVDCYICLTVHMLLL